MGKEKLIDISSELEVGASKKPLNSVTVINAKCIQHDFSKRELSKITGIPESTVSKIMNHKMKLTFNYAVKIAAALNVDAYDLMKFDKSETAEEKRIRARAEKLKNKKEAILEEASAIG